MELRPYRKTDDEQTIKLNELALQEAGECADNGQQDDDLHDIETFYAASGGECWVGESEGRIVAIGAFRKTTDDTAQIRRLQVSPQLRRRGYGRLMLNKLEERAKELGVVLLHLELSEGQTAAQAMYESSGYSVHERRLTDGHDITMYVKWLVPPPAAKEMTPEEEARFYADWDISQQLTDYAKQLLREGASPEEAMNRLLGSKLYGKWRKKKRSFNVQYDQLDMYIDLQSSVLSDERIGLIENKAAAYFEAASEQLPDSASVTPDQSKQSEEPYEFVFEGMGIRVTPSQLAMEMAALSKEVGLSRPIRYVHFLALFSGATIVDMEEDQLDCLVANQERAVALAEAFAEKYGAGEAP